MSNLFLSLAILSALCGVVSSIVIAAWLSKRGIKINYPFIRVLIIKYVDQYHKITRQEAGKPRPWFYSFVISMNLALVFAVVGFALKAI